MISKYIDNLDNKLKARLKQFILCLVALGCCALKISDLQAHNVSPFDTLRAYRSAAYSTF